MNLSIFWVRQSSTFSLRMGKNSSRIWISPDNWNIFIMASKIVLKAISSLEFYQRLTILMGKYLDRIFSRRSFIFLFYIKGQVYIFQKVKDLIQAFFTALHSKPNSYRHSWWMVMGQGSYKEIAISFIAYYRQVIEVFWNSWEYFSQLIWERIKEFILISRFKNDC